MAVHLMTWRRISHAALVGSIGLLTACAEQTLPPVFEENSAGLPVLDVSFTWDLTEGCRNVKSPPFTVNNVPLGTKFLRFDMYDRNRRAYNPGGGTGFRSPFQHGGSTIAYDGAEIAHGAFLYDGPCPDGRAHMFLWEVKALDRNKQILAKGADQLPYYRGGTEPADSVRNWRLGI